MQQDYTINDAHHDGFECGLLYILRYLVEEELTELDADNIAHLASHLESMKCWKSTEEWEELILGIYKKYPIRKFGTRQEHFK